MNFSLKFFRAFLSCFVIAVLLQFSLPVDSCSFLKTKGTDIVDSSGEPILLRGIGLGGWLVPEGYMMHIPGFGSPSSIRTLITELVGEDNATDFYKRYTENYVTEKDVEQLAAWGFNSIRLPFNYRMFSPEDQPDVFLEDGFQIIDQLLGWCEKHKLYLILDMHCAPGGQNAGNISDSDGEVARLWTDSKNQTLAVDIWTKIAEHYKDAEWIGGYDLINETAWDFGGQNTPLRNLMISITRAIRKVDTNHIVFIEGNWYATDFTSLSPIWDTNMAYSFHKYWSVNDTESIQSYLTLRNQNKVPLWVGEFGENSNPWIYDCTKLLEDNNIGWCFWPHKKFDTITGPLSVPITSNYQKVLDYWNNGTNKPSVDNAMQGLMEMADGLALNRCERHLDVLSPLFLEYSNKPTPFKTNVIPGFIQCVDYDEGKAGIAYADNDYQRTRWDIYQPWNKGGKYRNDGVDIDVADASSGSVYYAGWIEDGEWMLYTVNVQEAGKYTIYVKVAAQSSGGKIVVQLNSSAIANFNIPATGGWQTWKSVSAIASQPLNAGKQYLKLAIITGGFNISSIRFVPEGVGVEKKSELMPQEFRLEQNFPNPFNPVTTIHYAIPHNAFVSLKIYNTIGEEVDTLIHMNQMAGQHSVSYNATDLASGIYVYRLKADQFVATRKFVLVQ
ncbi:cellulase family glycosylhydrolase [candidate division KSB1 bacterium]|nr:cellulase family glycosylhydrolase [candidate division KSB1 bacterium]